MGEPHEDYQKRLYDLIGAEASTLQASKNHRGSTKPFVRSNDQDDVNAASYSKESAGLVNYHSSTIVPTRHSKEQELADSNESPDEEMSQYDVTELLVG